MALTSISRAASLIVRYQHAYWKEPKPLWFSIGLPFDVLGVSGLLAHVLLMKFKKTDLVSYSIKNPIKVTAGAAVLYFLITTYVGRVLVPMNESKRNHRPRD